MVKQERLLGQTIALLLFASPALAATPSFQPIGQLNPTTPYTEPTSLSDDGNTILGVYIISPNFDSFHWTRSGGFTPLNIPQGGGGSIHAGGSADGSVLAGTSYPPSFLYRWTQATGKQNLGTLPGFTGGTTPLASGISADGSIIVGTISGNTGAGFRDRTFRWTQASGITEIAPPVANTDMRTEGISPDGSIVVGNNVNGAFRWTQGGGFQSLGAGTAHDVSSDNLTIVGTRAAPGGSEAFRWTQAGGMVGLDDLPGGEVRSFPYDVSADGSRIVGYGGIFDGVNNVSRAVLWDSELGMLRIDQLLTDAGIDLTGWKLTTARAITPDGLTIAGTAFNPAGKVEGWIATVPEPSVAVGAILLLTLLSQRRVH